MKTMRRMMKRMKLMTDSNKMVMTMKCITRMASSSNSLLRCFRSRFRVVTRTIRVVVMWSKRKPELTSMPNHID